MWRQVKRLRRKTGLTDGCLAFSACSHAMPFRKVVGSVGRVGLFCNFHPIPFRIGNGALITSVARNARFA